MSSVFCQLWMGSLEPYMSENFILAAFRKMGENPTTVRLMRNKYTGELAGYAFVNFPTDEEAMDAMHKLNGKPIPGTNPLVRFRLNSATNSSKFPSNEHDFSIWVGDLSADVDDYHLYKLFSSKYTSVKTAKVILDGDGFSKGYGFVRFGIEDEQKSALYTLNGHVGLGTKPIRICSAVIKPKGDYGTYGGGGGESQYYDPSTYWSASGGYTNWQGYYDPQNATTAAAAVAAAQAAYYQQQIVLQQTQSQAEMIAKQAEAWKAQRNAQFEQQQKMAAEQALADSREHDLISYESKLDVDQFSQEAINSDRQLYDALESSKWMPLALLEKY